MHSSINQYAWYVLHTKPRGEYRAKKNLLSQGYKIFLPEYHKKTVKQGKIQISTEPLFLRYIFIFLNILESNWAPLRSTKGVNRIVDFGQGPISIDDKLIDQLSDSINTLSTHDPYNIGDEVLISKGPFQNLRAIYESPDGETRAFLLLNILNEKRKLSFDLESIEQY